MKNTLKIDNEKMPALKCNYIRRRKNIKINLYESTRKIPELIYQNSYK